LAWIETTDEDAARGVLADLYANVRDPASGAVDNILKVHSLHPEGLKGHFGVYRAAMQGTRGLSKAEREMIALVVSKTNGCHY
jgi:alkylhydroperoxidase family enzyme